MKKNSFLMFATGFVFGGVVCGVGSFLYFRRRYIKAEQILDKRVEKELEEIKELKNKAVEDRKELKAQIDKNRRANIKARAEENFLKKINEEEARRQHNILKRQDHKNINYHQVKPPLDALVREIENEDRKKALMNRTHEIVTYDTPLDDGYDEDSIMYYMNDDILCDDHDETFDDIVEIIGEEAYELVKKNPGMVYVMNHKMQIFLEVESVADSYFNKLRTPKEIIIEDKLSHRYQVIFEGEDVEVGDCTEVYLTYYMVNGICLSEGGDYLVIQDYVGNIIAEFIRKREGLLTVWNHIDDVVYHITAVNAEYDVDPDKIESDFRERVEHLRRMKSGGMPCSELILDLEDERLQICGYDTHLVKYFNGNDVWICEEEEFFNGRERFDDEVLEYLTSHDGFYIVISHSQEIVYEITCYAYSYNEPEELDAEQKRAFKENMLERQKVLDEKMERESDANRQKSIERARMRRERQMKIDRGEDDSSIDENIQTPSVGKYKSIIEDDTRFERFVKRKNEK
ncbi:MAG: hypothetical protein LBD57_04430 [Endomicrobium sp.]|jgi:hypothetical protein|uniref:hypothetical protein n=1 Tax=Candidatus Endomicrobiellum cubanum TaxID=3242325 RepID=UPI00281A5908|nr:hypothetical protein [Endomicrobium sp.]